MNFIDSAKIFVRSGDGGKGCASMRREKYIEFGGPDGGDGGKGGDVYFLGDKSLSTLMELRLHPHQNAGNGKPGQGRQKTGKSGEDLIIRVPLGTIVIDDETGETLFEVLEAKKIAVLYGGKGGLGNARFKTSTNQAPKYAQPGIPGEEIRLRLDLKLIADVGLVGLPNAGKSTFISSISNARPKIADYPFTTLIPNLGVVELDEFDQFIVADIPGIIEGAHSGTGLGDRFLRHIQRTTLLAFLIEISGLAQDHPIQTYHTLVKELKLYAPDMLEKKRLVLLTKSDAQNPDFDLQEILEFFKKKDEICRVISSVTREGLEEVKYLIRDLLRSN